jgi:outer membrane protein assembly factor BamB
MITVVATAAFSIVMWNLTSPAIGAELRRQVYVNQPDGSTHGGPGQGNGILVLDVDKQFSFVKRIVTPGILKVRQGVGGGQGMRGIAIDAKVARLYYTWHHGGKPGDDGGGCLDLKTDQVLWERSYDFTCERWQLSRDGKTLYTPCHWTDTKCRKVYSIDAATGEPARVYETGESWPNHPIIIHPDGKRLFFPAGCLDLESGKMLWPLTAQARESLQGFGGTCHIVLDPTRQRLYTGRHPESDTVATWIINADTGEIASKVPIDKERYPDLGGISEVVAFEPDGKHFWGESSLRRTQQKIERPKNPVRLPSLDSEVSGDSDRGGIDAAPERESPKPPVAREPPKTQELFIHLARYDNTTVPPTVERLVSLDEINAAHGLKLGSPKGHAMVTGAGDYVWFSCGAVLEARTGKFVCVMTAEDGKFTRGAKYVEATWIGDELVWAGQDECHGFIFDDYPIDRIRPLLPASSPLFQKPQSKELQP